MRNFFLIFFFMFSALWKAALSRPVMSSMVGLAVGTASSLTVVAVQPQPIHSSYVAAGYLAQAGPGDQGGNFNGSGGPQFSGGSGGGGGGGNGGGGGGGGPGGGPGGGGPGGGGNFGGPGGPQGGNLGGPPGGPGGPGGKQGFDGPGGPGGRPGGPGNFGGPGGPQGGNLGGPPGGPGGPGGKQGFDGPGGPQGGNLGGPPGGPGGPGGKQGFGGPGGPQGGNFEGPGNNQQGQGDRNFENQGNDNGQDQEEQQARQEEMQKKQEEMQKKQEEQGLKMMQKSMAQAARGVAQMKKYFDKVAKKGVAIPSDCTDALAKIQTTIDTIKNATTFDEAQEADPESMRDDFETLNECRQKVEMLSQIPNILKRVDKEIKNMERNWVRAKKNAPADAADAVSEGDAILQSIKDARQKIADAAKSGDMEDLQAILEDEIFGRFDDLGGAMQKLDAARNAKKFVAETSRRIRDAERLIAQLKKHGDDTSKLEELLAQAKQLYAQIKGMKTGSDEWSDAIDQLAELGDEFAQATGGNIDVKSQFQGPGGAGGPAPGELNFPKF